MGKKNRRRANKDQRAGAQYRKKLISLKEAIDKEYSREMDHWRNDLRKRVSEGLFKFKQDKEVISLSLISHLQQEFKLDSKWMDRKEFQKQFERWNKNFHSQMDKTKDNVEKESGFVRKHFSKKMDTLIHQVAQMREIDNNEEEEDTVTSSDLRLMYSDQIGVANVGDSHDENTEGEEEAYYSCSDDEAPSLIVKKRYLSARSSIEPFSARGSVEPFSVRGSVEPP
jgi:hypothetical protein